MTATAGDTRVSATVVSWSFSFHSFGYDGNFSTERVKFGVDGDDRNFTYRTLYGSERRAQNYCGQWFDRSSNLEGIMTVQFRR